MFRINVYCRRYSHISGMDNDALESPVDLARSVSAPPFPCDRSFQCPVFNILLNDMSNTGATRDKYRNHCWGALRGIDVTTHRPRP